MKRSRWLLAGFCVLIFHLGCASSRAGSLNILGRRGFIVGRDLFGNRVLAQRLNRNFAVGANGQLFRRVRGRFQPVFVRAGGQLVPVTINQFGQLQIGNNFQNFFQNPLAAPGGVAAIPPQGPNGFAPPTDGGQACGVNGFTGCFGGSGGHGIGPFPTSPRPAADPNVFGSDGKLTRDSCDKLGATFCGGVDPKQEQKIVRDNEERAIAALLLTPAGRQLGRGGLQKLAANALRVPALANLHASLMAALSNQVPGVAQIVADVKTNLKQAIRANMDPATASEVEGILDETEFVTSPPRNANGAVDPDGEQDFTEICGVLGTAPEAASVPKAGNRSKGRLYICPGFLLRALALGGIQGLAANLAFSIGHEFVHHFGADKKVKEGRVVLDSKFRPKYSRLLDCLRVGEEEGGETAADWLGGFQQLAERLRGKSPREAFEFVRASVSPLCDSRADGVHPAGGDRIGRMPASLLSILGCPANGPPATCTM